MLTIINWQDLTLIQQQQRLSRPIQQQNAMQNVQAVIAAVKIQGDEALKTFTQTWDKVILSNICIAREAIENAKIKPEEQAAIGAAIDTITYFHQAMKPKDLTVTTANGIDIARVYRPIQRVGLYVPGGNNTPLISSLLMQAIPARVAGCPIRVLCTPPKPDGSIDPRLLVAARLCEIETIYSIGGAQAIAAMAYGTQSVQKVDKIFGPGNQYVTIAKTQVSIDPNGAAIDLPAGPSEAMVLGDSNANPAFIAADLLAQAEHGVDSQVIYLCESLNGANAVNQEISKQLDKLTRREMIKKTLANSCIIICKERSQLLKIINDYAPEHLIINRKDAKHWVADIQTAGTIFLGPWAAETMGDYITGSNHVLPTNGYARTHSGLCTTDFLKAISVQSISEEGLETLGPYAETLAQIEGLDAHANAVTLRLENLRRIA